MMINVKSTSEQEYPRNLLEAIFGDEEEILRPEDITATIEYVMCRLSERERETIRQRYQKGRSYVEIAALLFDGSRERAKTAEVKALQKLKRPSNALWLKKGVSGMIREAQGDAASADLAEQIKRIGEKVDDISEVLDSLCVYPDHLIGKKR